MITLDSNYINYFENIINPPYIFLYSHFSQIEVQMIQLILSIFFGILMAVTTDIINGIRKNFKYNNIINLFLFIILLIGYIIFQRLFCFIFAGSTFRIFFIIGNLIGFILWEFTLGYYCLTLARNVVGFIKKIICFFILKRRKFVRFAKNRKKRKNKSKNSWKIWILYSIIYYI